MRMHLGWLILAAVSMISASLYPTVANPAAGPTASRSFAGASRGAGLVFGQVLETSKSAGEELHQPALPDPEDPFLKKMVKVAKDDLARRQSAKADQIELLEVKEVTWSDAGLGCPKPGMAYAQIPQDGLLIRLRMKERMFSYHSGGTGAPFLCEKNSGAKSETQKLDKDVRLPNRLHH